MLVEVNEEVEVWDFDGVIRVGDLNSEAIEYFGLRTSFLHRQIDRVKVALNVLGLSCKLEIHRRILEQDREKVSAFIKSLSFVENPTYSVFREHLSRHSIVVISGSCENLLTCWLEEYIMNDDDHSLKHVQIFGTSHERGFQNHPIGRAKLSLMRTIPGRKIFGAGNNLLDLPFLMRCENWMFVREGPQT